MTNFNTDTDTLTFHFVLFDPLMIQKNPSDAMTLYIAFYFKRCFKCFSSPRVDQSWRNILSKVQGDRSNNFLSLGALAWRWRCCKNLKGWKPFLSCPPFHRSTSPDSRIQFLRIWRRANKWWNRPAASTRRWKQPRTFFLAQQPWFTLNRVWWEINDGINLLRERWKHSHIQIQIETPL